MTTPSIKIHEVEPHEQHLITRLLDLFVLIFPEYTGYAAQIEQSIIQGRDYNPKVIPHHWVIEYGGDMVGFTVFNYLLAGNFGFGRYIGVDPAFRKSGVGFEIIQHSLEQVRLDAASTNMQQPIGFCAEVETPDEAETEEERKIRNLRLSYFLNRCGAQELNVDYLEPTGIRDIAENGEEVQEHPVPMHLLLFPDRSGIDLNFDATEMMVKRVLLDHYLLDPNNGVVEDVLRTVGRATHMYPVGE